MCLVSSELIKVIIWFTDTRKKLTEDMKKVEGG